MTDALVARIAAHYGPLFALIIIGLDLLLQRESTAARVCTILGGGLVVYYVTYRLTFAVAWNRRAARLRARG